MVPATTPSGRGGFLFRCDGNAATGLGHVSRCIALAEALAEIGVRCVFAGDFAEAARSLLDVAGFPFVRARPFAENGADAGTLRLLAEAKAVSVVVDSYGLSESHLAELHRESVNVVVIDDFAQLAAYPCTAVLNFTVNAPHLEYPKGPRYLLGPNYLLVRRRLRHLRARRLVRSGPVRRLLVAVGGTDRHQLARRIVEALAELSPNLVIRLAAAPAEMAEPLARFGAGSGLIPMGQDLAEEFASTDACISGGGLMKYEAAYLGVPGAVLSQTPEQAEETEYFVQHRLAFDLGLGPGLPQRDLVERLKEFLAAGEVRQTIGEAGQVIFPDDPTRQAAEAIAASLTN